MKTFDAFRGCKDARTEQKLNGSISNMSKAIVPAQKFFLGFIEVEIGLVDGGDSGSIHGGSLLQGVALVTS